MEEKDVKGWQLEQTKAKNPNQGKKGGNRRKRRGC